VIAAQHDQFTTPDEMAAAVSAWSNCEIISAPGVDHSFAVNAGSLCNTALSRLLETIS
jgi:hypothetical protein